MAVAIKMPQLSQTTEDVKLISWLVEEGQQVKKGDNLCEVETDKAVMPVESFESGTVLKLMAEPDTMVMSGTVIALLGKPGENIDQLLEGGPSTAVTADFTETSPGPVPAPVQQPSQGTAPVPGHQPEPALSPGPVAPVSSQTGAPIDKSRIKATPLVINIAKKKNIPLENVTGSGPGGLITKKDLEEYAARPEAFRQKAGKPVSTAAGHKEYQLSKNQTHVARNLTRSFTQVPHYYLKCRVYTDTLLSWREKNKLPDGSKVSVYSILVYAAARTLKKFPGLNGFYRDNKLVLFNGINIGIAVTAGDDLHVPVIRDADKKSIRDIDREVRWLVAKAQNGKLEPRDILDGTFTLTNLGTYPVDEFCAIINPPQAGIVAIGHMTKTIFVDENDAMSIRTACTVTGSFDHRIVNGAKGAAFLEYYKKLLEEEITE
jgi:pyruvate dehydrogenase E2 component (dihydrolipoamide acetyltransferase)